MMRHMTSKKKKPFSLRRTSASFVENAVMILFSFTCIFPVVWMFISTFKTESEFYTNVISLPETLNLENYKSVLFESNLMVYMKNSFLVTFVSVALIVLIGFISGYFLARFKFRGSKFIYLYFLAGMLVPIHSLMIPIYILFNKLHLNDRQFTLVLPYVTFGIPIAMFLVQSYIKNIPVEIEEAACIDGSSFTRRLFTVVFPLCKPILVTVAIIQFFACWNEFTFALTLTDSDALRTIPLGLSLMKGQYTQNYPQMMTIMFVSILPVMILYFIFSKQIIKGMVAGAVKG